MELTSLVEVWDTADERPWATANAASIEETAQFKSARGATRVTKLRWNCGGERYECNYPAAPHPDRQSIAVYDESHPDGFNATPNPTQPRHLRVLDAHGVLLYRIKPPHVDGKSIPERGWVDLPRAMPEYGLVWGVPANDGYRDIALDIDWSTGQIKRQVEAPYLRY